MQADSDHSERRFAYSAALFETGACRFELYTQSAGVCCLQSGTAWCPEVGNLGQIGAAQSFETLRQLSTWA